MSGGHPALPVRFLGVFDPRGRAEALDRRFSRMTGIFAPGAWKAARLEDAAAARSLRLAALVPAGAREAPEALIRRVDGRIACGAARLYDDEAAGPDPAAAALAAAGADLERLARTDAAGAFDRLSVGPAAAEGDWAAALFDPARPALRLMRDAMGHEPLYFMRLGDGATAFANWIHPLRALEEAPRDPDPEALETFLIFRLLPGTRTVWPGIEALPPGTRLDLDASGAAGPARCWAPGPDPALAGLGDAELLEAISARARAAVTGRARRLGGAPALMFSGGLDSSLVAGLLCADDPGREVHGFAAASREGAYPAERAAREAMAARWPNLRVHEMDSEGLDPLDGAEHRWRRDGAPNPDVTAYSGLALQRTIAAAGHGSVMGGQGGDRLVSAPLYGKLHDDLVHLRLREVARDVGAMRRGGIGARRLISYGLVKPNPLFDLWRRRKPGREVLGAVMRAPGRARVEGWLAEGLTPWMPIPRRIRDEEVEALASCPPWTHEDLVLFGGAEAGAGAPPAALAYGSPLLDTRLTSAVIAAPSRLKVHGGQRRGVIRALLADVAPPEIAARPDKAPFQPDMERLGREAVPRLRAAMPAYRELPLWRELVDRGRLEAAFGQLEVPGARRWVMELARVQNAYFLGEFLQRVEARDPSAGP